MDTNENRMPVIKDIWYEKGFGVFAHWSKIGEHKRKTGEKMYISPRIVLPSEFNRYIGRSYTPFHAEIEMKLASFQSEALRHDCIILVFDKE